MTRGCARVPRVDLRSWILTDHASTADTLRAGHRRPRAGRALEGARRRRRGLDRLAPLPPRATTRTWPSTAWSSAAHPSSPTTGTRLGLAGDRDPRRARGGRAARGHRRAGPRRPDPLRRDRPSGHERAPRHGRPRPRSTTRCTSTAWPTSAASAERRRAVALRDVDGQDRGLDGAVGGDRPRPRARGRDGLGARPPRSQPVLIGPVVPIEAWSARACDDSVVIVDCALYVGGVRQAGRFDPATADAALCEPDALRLDRPLRADPSRSSPPVRDVVPPPRAGRRGRPQGPPAPQARALRRHASSSCSRRPATSTSEEDVEFGEIQVFLGDGLPRRTSATAQPSKLVRRPSRARGRGPTC